MLNNVEDLDVFQLYHVDSPALTPRETQLLSNLTGASPYFTPYIMRSAEESCIMLFARLKCELKDAGYWQASQEIADILPGVDVVVYSSRVVHEEGIAVIIPKDLSNEAEEIRDIADSIVSRRIRAYCFDEQDEDFYPLGQTKPVLSDDSPGFPSLLSKDPPPGTHVGIGSIVSFEWDMTHGLTNNIYVVTGEEWPIRPYNFGGYDLEGNACALWLRALMEFFETETLNEKGIVGRNVRVAFDPDGKFVAIGRCNPADPDKCWFTPETVFTDL